MDWVGRIKEVLGGWWSLRTNDVRGAKHSRVRILGGICACTRNSPPTFSTAMPYTEISVWRSQQSIVIYLH